MSLKGAIWRPFPPRSRDRVRNMIEGSKGTQMNKRSSETKARKTADTRGERSGLDCQYGNIGISAVAAACRYTGDHRKSPQQREQDRERAANRRRSVLAV